MNAGLKQLLGHWSPRYLKNRISFWSYYRRFPEVPKLTRQAIAILEDWLKPGDIGIEWGSGRSTSWFASRVGRLTSIEHTREWYDRVLVKLSEKGLSNTELLYLPLARPDESSPETDYLKIPADFQEESCDFALVDGRLRDYCTEIAMRLLKRGGLLIIDNAERHFPGRQEPATCGDQPPSELWEILISRLQSWRSFWTTDGVTATVFFIKPVD